MASERKIAANRRNARKSTGPRSGVGKRRASRNSYCHGLSAGVIRSVQRGKRIERLARKIAGKATDVAILESARDAAQAEFDLAQIRRIEVALIEWMLAFGEFQALQAFELVRELKRLLNALDRGRAIAPAPVKSAATVPYAAPDRLAEAVRRALPELLKLDRYKQRAAAVRERSIRAYHR